MKRLIIIIIALLYLLGITRAQIYDGMTQPNKYRLWVTVSQPVDAGTATLSGFFGYKVAVCDWFSVTGVANYNVSANSFQPAVWLNFSAWKTVYLLSRSIYDIRGGQYVQAVSASVKIPKGFMVDFTWDGVTGNKNALKNDRLQVVCGWGNPKITFNVGYSFRHGKGLVANIRYKMTERLWAQVKYDAGKDIIQFHLSYNFD